MLKYNASSAQMATATLAGQVVEIMGASSTALEALTDRLTRTRTGNADQV